MIFRAGWEAMGGLTMIPSFRRRRYLASAARSAAERSAEGRHAAGDIALFEERAQLLGRLPRYPLIHGEAGRFSRAASILAVAARTVLMKQFRRLLREQGLR